MKSIQQILVTMIFLIFSLPSFALSTDRDQPANIEADDIEFDFKKGIRTYKKNVLIVQGTLRIKADNLVTTYDGSELTEAVAIGSLAQFKQRPDDKPDDVEGWAEKIVVDQKQNIITLYGKAALKQGSDTARGETIVYNMATDTLKVQGGAKVNTAGADGKTPPDLTGDPFKPVPPTVTPTQVQATSDTDVQPTANTTGDSTSTVPAPITPDTVPAGRSRLIIQPK